MQFNLFWKNLYALYMVTMKSSYLQFDVTKFSKDELRYMKRPFSVGVISEEYAESVSLRLCKGKEEAFSEGYTASIYILIDTIDGIIVDVKYDMLAPVAFSIAFEIVASHLLRKNYDQARRITSDYITKLMVEKGCSIRYESEKCSNLLVNLLSCALLDIDDIPLSSSYAPPSPFNSEGSGEPKHPDFLAYSSDQQLSVLAQIIEKDITPFVELDAGGVAVTGVAGNIIIIAYSGSCSSCFAATGSTLSAIQSILRSKVHKDLTVEPDPSSLNI